MLSKNVSHHSVASSPKIQQAPIYVVVVKNSFFSKRPFLAEKKITLAKLSPYSQKTFAGPYVGLYLGILLGNRSLTREICLSERPSRLILWRLRIHVWRFAFIGGPCSPSRASSDTPTPKLRAHLLPASLETRHNKSTV